MLETLARAQFQTGQRAEAIATLKRALEFAPPGRRPELEQRLAEFQARQIPRVRGSR